MAWMKQVRGPYMCYSVEKDFLTAHLIEQRTKLMEDVNNHEHDIALDIRKLHNIDGLALRFLVNTEELLDQKGHHIVLVGGEPDIVTKLLTAHNFKHFATMADFELEFHEINPGLLKSILKLAQGGVGFKMLQLECPLCKFNEVTGFVIDESCYQVQWTPREIIPVWFPAKPDAENIDYSAYRVAICPECFFASTRPDYFSIHFPEGDIKTILKPEQITNLAINGSARKALANEVRESSRASFFQPPRDRQSAYLSWKLHELCQKQLSTDRHFIDAFEIVLANFMMCKYATTERLVGDHLHTALAWLNNLMQNQTHYSTNRLIQAHTYYISVLLALDKLGEAQRGLADFQNQYRDVPEADFWLGRVEALVNDALEDLEKAQK